MEVTKKSFSFPKKHDMPLYCVSAADGTNVVRLFRDAIRLANAYRSGDTPDFVDQILRELEVGQSERGPLALRFFEELLVCTYFFVFLLLFTPCVLCLPLCDTRVCVCNTNTIPPQLLHASCPVDDQTSNPAGYSYMFRITEHTMISLKQSIRHFIITKIIRLITVLSPIVVQLPICNRRRSRASAIVLLHPTVFPASIRNSTKRSINSG